MLPRARRENPTSSRKVLFAPARNRAAFQRDRCLTRPGLDDPCRLSTRNRGRNARNASAIRALREAERNVGAFNRRLPVSINSSTRQSRDTPARELNDVEARDGAGLSPGARLAAAKERQVLTSSWHRTRSFV